jgi:6-phosphogluconolactonase
MVVVLKYSDKAQLGSDAAQAILTVAAAAIAARGKFTVAFSGGSLPGLVCPSLVEHILASPEAIESFAKWHIFLADERYVPLDDPECNFLSVKKALLDVIAKRNPDVVKLVKTYPINPDIPLAECAAAYAAALKDAASTGDDGKDSEIPVLDLTLLGMGPDAHTASLFPNHELLTVTDQVVALIENSPKPPPKRITLTLPVINYSRNIFFVCTGDGKKEVLKHVLEDPEPNPTYPSSLVKVINGGSESLKWYVDTDAAKLLEKF